MSKSGYPPISKAELDQLRLDSKNVRAAAERKGTTLDRWEEAEESAVAKSNFMLGSWLYYYSKQVDQRGQHALKNQIDCLYRLFRAGFDNPGYQFFTVFNFGERQFDGLLEDGNASQVLQGLREIYQKHGDKGIADAFAYFGWSLADDRQLAMF
jgi:hypothetical protein